MAVDSRNKRVSIMSRRMPFARTIFPTADGAFSNVQERLQLAGMYSGIGASVPVFPMAEASYTWHVESESLAWKPRADEYTLAAEDDGSRWRV